MGVEGSGLMALVVGGCSRVLLVGVNVSLRLWLVRRSVPCRRVTGGSAGADGAVCAAWAWGVEGCRARRGPSCAWGLGGAVSVGLVAGRGGLEWCGGVVAVKWRRGGCASVLGPGWPSKAGGLARRGVCEGARLCSFLLGRCRGLRRLVREAGAPGRGGAKEERAARVGGVSEPWGAARLPESVIRAVG